MWLWATVDAVSKLSMIQAISGPCVLVVVTVMYNIASLQIPEPIGFWIL